VRLAEQYRLPAIYAAPAFAAEGGLMSYGSDGIEVAHGAASYIDRILRGAKISDLPLQYPTRFRLVINLKAAKAIGFTIPDSLLLRADQLIELRVFILTMRRASLPRQARRSEASCCDAAAWAVVRGSAAIRSSIFTVIPQHRCSRGFAR
jgi:hypothetical protein